MVSTHLPIKDVYTERTGVIFMQKYFPNEMIGNKFMDGATELQLEDFVNSLESTYGSSLDGVD